MWSLHEVKTQDNFGFEGLGKERIPVRVDFIIAPQQLYFTPLNAKENVLIKKASFDSPLDELLNKHIFSSQNDCIAYQELRTINNIPNVVHRLNSLIDWLDSFSDNKNVTGENQSLILNMLKEKQGVCRHKAMIFQLLCDYWGIPARQVSNVSHGFVEISSDGGESWRQYQVGGGGRCKKTVTDSMFSQYRQSKNSSWKQPILRSRQRCGRNE